MKHALRFIFFFFLFSFFSLSFAHWADLSAAEIATTDNTTQIVLTFPTGLVAEMDTDGNQILSESEIHLHHSELTNFFIDNISLTDSQGQKPSITLNTVTDANIPPALGIAPGTHSTVKLIYTWKETPRAITIDYNLFLPGVPTASCLATLLQAGSTHTFVFTPENRTLTLEQGAAPFW
jgi:nickel/cobalt transporter (NicO) family protein